MKRPQLTPEPTCIDPGNWGLSSIVETERGLVTYTSPYAWGTAGGNSFPLYPAMLVAQGTGQVLRGLPRTKSVISKPSSPFTMIRNHRYLPKGLILLHI